LHRHLPARKPAGVIDTLRLAKATYTDLSSYTLDALIKHVAPDLSQAPRVGRHRATYDAYATAKLLLSMAEHYETWDQLIAAAVPPALPGAPQPEEDPTLW
jgi:DNA polymerase-3 subunit epsilon/exodeoxyribonuclease X